ncbi:hypothetical protein DFP73DRAFT_560907 [Morchella snyderi]|nr:hypothetical protein DFP73DRAFT_560907 [Morchella snyderi]
MSHADQTSEASSVATAPYPDAVPPPFLAELSSLTSQETLVLKLQSDKIDCQRTLLRDLELLLDHPHSVYPDGVFLSGDFARRTVEASALAMWKRAADYEGCIRVESAQLDKMESLVADSRRLRVEMLRTQREHRSEQTQILKERDKLREDARRAVWLHRGAVGEVETLRRQLSEEKKLHDETRLMGDRQTSKLNDKEKELREVTLEVLGLREELHKENKVLLEEISKGRDVREEMEGGIEKLRAELREETSEVVLLRAQLSEEKKLHEEARQAMDQKISEQNDNAQKELYKVNWKVLVLQAQLSEQKRLHEEARLARDQLSEQNRGQKELSEESKKENTALLEEISKEREAREEMKSEIERLRAELQEETSEVVFLREELSEEKKFRKEIRLARDQQVSEQSNKQKELYEELQKENKALLEEVSKGREVREVMKSEIEELRMEFLEEGEHLREQIKVEMKLEQAEQERSRRAQLVRQSREISSSERATARD